MQYIHMEVTTMKSTGAGGEENNTTAQRTVVRDPEQSVAVTLLL